MAKKKLDKDEVKSLANGRWSEILAPYFPTNDGKHSPCPKCGGKDRFRFSDLDGNGSCICNQCFRTGGDGLAAIQWFTGCSFVRSVQETASFLGVETSLGSAPDRGIEWSRSDSETRTKISLWLRYSANGICLDACIANGMRAGVYWRNWPVVALPGYDSSLDLREPTMWMLFHCTGMDLPTGRKENRQWVKSKSTGPAGKPCLFGRYALERLGNESIERIIKVEGGKDLLAGWSITPEDSRDQTLFVSNAYGAVETPGWMASAIGKCKAKQAFVLHDTDEAGETGAKKWARAIGMARDDKQCGIIHLPFEKTDKGGKDLRDWAQ